jgi:5-methyltetrahydropteroyltriglutamate--homocysteine methyltransferase
MVELDVLGAWTDRDGASLGFGVVEVLNPHVESAQEVAQRIRTALEHVPAERLVVSTGCGLYQLPRDLAFRKLRNLVGGTRIVRRELGRGDDGRARPVGER